MRRDPYSGRVAARRREEGGLAVDGEPEVRRRAGAGVADGVAETPGPGAGFPHALATIATAASRPTARRVCRLTERPRACSGRRDITGSARGRGRRVEGFNEIDRP